MMRAFEGKNIDVMKNTKILCAINEGLGFFEEPIV